MIKAQIKQGTNSVIEATGSITELLGDMAVLVGGIYTQFQNADPTTAQLFRQGMTNMAVDPNSPMWQSQGNQTGIIFPMPDQEA